MQLASDLFSSFTTSLLDRVRVIVIVRYRIAFDNFHNLYHLFSRAV